MNNLNNVIFNPRKSYFFLYERSFYIFLQARLYYERNKFSNHIVIIYIIIKLYEYNNQNGE